MLVEQARTMASYNRWMNQKLYAVCSGLSDEERKADQGAFFRSIHGTLNHLLVGDVIWMGRFTGRAFSADGLDREFYADFEELKAAREGMDERIEAWAAGLTDQILQGKLEYTSIVNPKKRGSVRNFVCEQFSSLQSVRVNLSSNCIANCAFA